MASKYTPTNETANFGKFARIILDLCRDAVFEIVSKEIPPADLPSEVRANLHKLKLSWEQSNKILTIPAGVLPCSSDFDFSALYTLIRNICPGIPNPTRGWGRPPQPNDINVSDDIERIRQKRNGLFGHASTAALSDTDFYKELTEMKSILSRLDKYLSQNFLSGLSAIESSTMDPAMQQIYIQKCLKLLKQDQETRDQLDAFKTQQEKENTLIKDQQIGAQLRLEETIDTVLVLQDRVDRQDEIIRKLQGDEQEKKDQTKPRFQDELKKDENMLRTQTHVSSIEAKMSDDLPQIIKTEETSSDKENVGTKTEQWHYYHRHFLRKIPSKSLQDQILKKNITPLFTMKGVGKLFGSKHAVGRGKNEHPVEMEHNTGIHSVLSSDRRTPKKARALMVAAIDFGTTYSGWGYSFRDDFERDPANVIVRTWYGDHLVSEKAPTCVLLEKKGSTVKLKSFGYDAETDYTELVSDKRFGGHYFFERFKMMQFGDKNIHGEVMLEDTHGQNLPALTVFKLAIQYLKDDLLVKANQKSLPDYVIYRNDIHWVITVPAICSDSARHFMREAAEQAGIASDMLTIALEPEAASLYCRHFPLERSTEGSEASLPTLRPGTKYMVVDAGGGTVDVAVHEIMEDNKLKEFRKDSRGAWGGTRVDDAFLKLLVELFGEPVMNKLQEDAREDYLDLFRSFEAKKRTFNPTKSSYAFRMPLQLSTVFEEMTGEKLTNAISEGKYAGKITLRPERIRINADIVAGLFEESVVSIVVQIKCLMQKPGVEDISCIFLVGGFSEAPILQERIRGTFPRLKMIVPRSPGLAVLEGAVIFGYSPCTVTERVSRYTYGIAVSMPFQEGVHPSAKKIVKGGKSLCVGNFSILVQAGQTVKIGEAQEKVYENTFGALSMELYMYATPDPNPRFVTDSGCLKIGTIRVPGNENNERIKVKTTFGGTEIEVHVDAMSVKTGEQATIDFLE